MSKNKSLMRAMVLEKVGQPLVLQELPIPTPGPAQILIEVHVCGICRTDLHVVDGDLPSPALPLIPGHQIVGHVIQKGNAVTHFSLGDRIGVPWLGGSCGHCPYCLENQENLCDDAIYTGYQVNGGFAQYCVANADFAFPLPTGYDDVHVAPLLCAGLIGYRALKLTGNAKRIGFYGFGASAHILAQVIRAQGGEVYAFTRGHEDFAKKLGAVWVGKSSERPPVQLDAAIVFAPVGELVPLALQAVKKGGVVTCAGIHMSDIPSFPYRYLWEERILKSVTNLTRLDGKEFFALAQKIPIQTEVTVYPLERANEALTALRQGKLAGAAVLSLYNA